MAILASLLVVGGDSEEAAAQDNVARFNHESHLDKVRNCTGCHVLDKRTWVQKSKVSRNHKPCNTGVCHGEEWKKEPGPFCLTCHQTNLKVVYPPYRQRGESDWVLTTFNHTDHIARNGGDSQACSKCHNPLRVKRPKKGSTTPPAPDMSRANHKECAKCHAKGIQPAMGDCTACHTLRTGEVEPARSAVWDNHKVSFAFRHKGHEKASKLKAKGNCTTCHQNVSTKTGEVVPLPAMTSCETCHNGSVAFNALGHDCRRCHSVPEGGVR